MKNTLRIRDSLLSLETPQLMGVLNITPDSFYAGSRHNTAADWLKTAGQMLEEGATFIDIGGYSSRPGAASVPEAEERNRVIPAIKSLIQAYPEIRLSVDTFRATVAQAALDEGASMINDISGGLEDDAMISVVAAAKVPYVCMHMRGTPQTMASLTSYNNLVRDMLNYFQQRLTLLRERGIVDIIIDPGFGFAKTTEQNFRLLHELPRFLLPACPLMVGVSRKSMVWKTLDTTPDDALNGTSVLHTLALLNGASMLRVHDVKEATQVVKLVAEYQKQAKNQDGATN